MFEINVKRVHAPRGKENLIGKQETAPIIEGDVKLRFHIRFICVGVDINIYALLIAEGVNTSMSRAVYCTHVSIIILCRSFPACVWLSSVVRSCATRDANNKDNVCKPNIPARIK